MPELFRQEAPRVTVSELPAESIAVLRLRRSDAALLTRAGDALGVPLAVEPGRVTGDDPRVCWLAPDEWMIAGGADRLAALEQAVAGATAHVARIGEGRRRFRVTGPDRRDLLAKGSSLDLHPAVFGEGRCARTLFAQVLALIDARPDLDAFDLVVDVSVAAYLRQWFDDAMLEFKESLG